MTVRWIETLLSQVEELERGKGILGAVQVLENKAEGWLQGPWE